MKVSCSNGLAPGDVVRRRWPCLVGEWKIQFTGVFPLFNAPDAALDGKNDLVSSQNAFSTKGSIIARFFKSQQIWRRDFQFCWSGLFIPDPGSRIRIFSIPDPGFWIRIFSILDPWSRIQIFSIPDPGSRIRIKEFKYFNQKKWFLSSQKYDSGFPPRIRIPDLDPDFLPIPDPDPVSQIPNPGVKKAPEPWSGIPDPDSQHWRFWLCSGCRGTIGYWSSTGAAVFTTHLMDQLSEAFMCKKEFFLYFISTLSL